ncbi:hypothetical protein B9G98_01139 [Wickerhamiella sorbophila]|uniref:RRN6 beta-propeller domain-containing protein n=1 Tax=Wickerhamiella sorbophila TaxID=45607 RepID=A0A2T0FEX4_9ASCO|nr:hypothetical protein B9G98_01139 [Wickerhamiella sorbophila]PRT53519.1 hypothetical protein B9G98_01139 [Wickerhamiella sorbophila]
MWTHRLGYGHPGGIKPDPGGFKVARRNESARLYDGGTRIVDIGAEEDENGKRIGEWGPPSFETYRMAQQTQNMDIGFVPQSIVQDYSYQSYVATSPATLDPTIGPKLCLFSDSVVFANDRWLSFYGQEWTHLDMGSLVTGVSPGLARTRDSVYRLSTNTAQVVCQSDSMDACLHGEFTAVLSSRGDVRIYNLNQEHTNFHLPRGSKQGWGRIGWTNETTVLWTNRKQCAFVDIRTPSPRDSVLFEFSGNPGELLDMSFVGNDALILNSAELAWVDTRMKRTKLAWEHFFSPEDYTLRLTGCNHNDQTLALITSQLHPFTTIYTLGTSEGDAVSTRDPYVIETWPYACPQSILPISKGQEITMYIAGVQGQLFEQVLSATEGCHENYSIDPEPTASNPREEWKQKQVDFDLSVAPDNQHTLGFANLYKYVTELAQPALPQLGSPKTSVLEALGYESIDAFKKHSYNMWISPLEDQSLAGPRLEAIEWIASHVASYETKNVDLKVKLTPDIKVLSDEWEDEPEQQEEEEEQMYPATQPAPSYGISSSQPAVSFMSQPTTGISLSQPAPARKPKKKTKKRKRTEGFA